MKSRIVTFIICVLTAGAAAGQARVDYNSMSRIDGICYHNGARFTGETVGYTIPAGEPIVVQYVDGVQHGWLTAYYDDACAVERCRVPVVMGKQHGVYTSYYEDGAVEFTLKKRRGMIEGKRYCYNEDGSLWHVHNYRCGRQNGVMLTFNADGTLHIRNRFRGDALNGRCRIYLDDGVREKGRFLNDKRTGVWKIYSSDGKLAGRVRFVDGRETE